MKNIFRFPLKQHIGMPAAPAIVKDDRIARGQLIASMGEGLLGANIFSSVSGVVTEITEQEIVILADEKQPKEYIKLTKEEPLELIQEAGLVGLGGAGFPTYAKLSRPFEKGGVVIVNAAECEPILAHNIAAIEKNPKQLLAGLRIVMNIMKADRGLIAIKEVHKKAVEVLRDAICQKDIEIVMLPDLYPMGEERAVIREALGTLLPVDALPMDAKAVVINAETICRIQEAVDLKKPLIDKNMTVAGKIRGNENLIQVFWDVPIGISVGEMFCRAGGLAEDCGELIMGGPFTGRRTAEEEPVVKTTGGLIAAECFMKGPE